MTFLLAEWNDHNEAFTGIWSKSSYWERVDGEEKVMLEERCRLILLVLP